MPRNVRNFWIELSVDGRESRIETGPRSKDGGFHIRILQRDKGGITRAMEIDGRPDMHGNLVLQANLASAAIGEPSIRVTTKR